ncbi:dienelactone hydrolase family protein [Massilia sp. CF038]|uniref:dienelactone hydrolase family protein n=1 Tax=Massilia sp. CF038 TaxID=1881045 RepID=UPI00091103A2|nr:hydrolase [Massilia sp. CF038]SHG66490.1 putative phosphoribosyl transferase [Massilia sp. CF038]
MTSGHRQLLTLSVDSVVLEGVLALPPAPRGMVLFAHGSGSSRLSPRNNAVAAHLREAGMGTLLMDLLGEHEQPDTAARFNIALLARRLGVAADWLADHSATHHLPLGLFGASTGAAAALSLAAERAALVRAVVSRGGRPELADGAVLPAVRAPTLLIVGALDAEVAALNRRALALLQCEKRLDIVPAATHLFEEAGALQTVAQLAAGWFSQHLAGDVPA